jgi:hypothetical protein
MKNAVFVLLVLLTPSPAGAKVFYVHPAADPVGAVVIDHNCGDLSAIPQIHIAPAASLRLLLRHASVGQGIGWGLDCFAGLHPTNSECSCYPPGQYPRDNWVLELRGGNWKDKVDDLVTQAETRTDEFDVFTMKFCYIDALGDSHPDWDYYRAAMEQLELDYPDKVFVWWTIPLTRDGMPGTDFFNALVRSYCRANGKILFDIADIECHDPNGLKQTNAQGCEVICQDYTKEIHAGHLNVPGRIRVASAIWQLMASIAGWHKGSIQAAIDAASNGDTIVVEEGTYFESINFRGKNIVLTSTDPNDPKAVAATVIDGNNLESVVTFAGTENDTAVLSGFAIRNGFQDYIYTRGGGGICGGSEENHTHATIQNNIITRNFAWDGGGLSRCDGLIEKNTITANTARWYQGGGGLYLCNGAIRNNIISFHNAGGCESAGGLSYCDAVIENNTIAHNFSHGIGVIAHGGGTIRNCIIWGNLPQEIWNAAPSFSCLQGWTGGGIGNIDADPCFADPNNGDYHLKSQAGRWDANEGRWTIDEVTSPCIDAGDPMSPIGLEPFPNGGRINMGAYGGTAEASKSYFDKAPCEIIVAGDIDGDCAVNFLDFRLMALRWLTNGNF